MKYILLFLVPIIANADCFYNNQGQYMCVYNPKNLDVRTDFNSPKLYEYGQYRGNLNNNPYDPNSVSNRYGPYGSPYSPSSINNPYRVR